MDTVIHKDGKSSKNDTIDVAEYLKMQTALAKESLDVVSPYGAQFASPEIKEVVDTIVPEIRKAVGELEKFISEEVFKRGQGIVDAMSHYRGKEIEDLEIIHSSLNDHMSRLESRIGGIESSVRNIRNSRGGANRN
ncbi:hypothetical protein MNB_SV-4-140 [hydrothermal vent metagenome]|uniref:Uncharacterized protein n=1 Tax=hydrothermal vent metagenome TaxID=652676 RepID=A0A1W1EAY3_9ZZZZ